MPGFFRRLILSLDYALLPVRLAGGFGGADAGRGGGTGTAAFGRAGGVSAFTLPSMKTAS